MPISVTDHHVAARAAVKAVLDAVGIGLTVYALDDPESDIATVDLPAVVVACVGPEQERSELHTNVHDGIGFPVAVLLMGLGQTSGTKSASLPNLTLFRRQVRVSFHNKRLSAVSQNCWCEVSDSGPIYDKDSPAVQKLQTALVVTCVGRYLRE